MRSALAIRRKTYGIIRDMKTILFFQTGSSETARLKFEGVASFARTVGWDARIITNASTRQPLGKILSFWKPAGCIVEASGGAQGLSPSAFGKTRTGHMAAELLSRLAERFVPQTHLPPQDRALSKRRTRPPDEGHHRAGGTPLTNAAD